MFKRFFSNFLRPLVPYSGQASLSRLLCLVLLMVAIPGWSAVVAKYDFEQNLLDSSGNANHANLKAGTVTYGVRSGGRSAVFNGSTVVSMPNDLIRSQGDFTITFYFKTTSSNMVMFGYENRDHPGPPTNFIPIAGITADGKFRADLWTGSVLTVRSADAVNDGAWHKARIYADQTNSQLKIYIDGQLAGSTTGSIVHLDMAYNFLGYSHGLTRYGSSYYTGELDEWVLEGSAQAPPAATAPDAPVVGSVVAGDGQVTVNFTPGYANGSAITSFTATSNPGGLTATCAASPCTVTGLTNGTAYTFTVTATNSAGTSNPSVASSPVTAAAAVTAPGVPTGVTATAGNAQATVSWTAPSSNGSAVTGYTATAVEDPAKSCASAYGSS
ncbi:MAG: fibronectin type III domain-containing protein [Luminiphilus sp.]